VKIFFRLYRAALYVLPRDFRERHGAQALRMAASRVREETGGRRVRRAGAELANLVFAAPRIRRALAAGRRHTPQLSTPLEEHTMQDALLSDIRYASRSLLRAKGFLAVALTTLGAGMALCASMIVLVNAYLVRGLPYPDSDRLFWIQYGEPGAPGVLGLDALEWRALSDVIEQPIAWDLDLFSMRGAPYPEAAQGSWVSSGFLDGFGVRPARGRAFEPADFEANRPPVAVISHRLWQGRFGGDPSIVGRQFQAYVSDRPAEAETFTVVGVLPEGLWHQTVYMDVIAPLRAPSYPYMARLQRGVSPEVAAERISSFVRTGATNVPDGWRASLTSAHARYVQQIQPLLTALATATALVMLIAAANVAVLFTVRATHRRREIAVRKALGASAGRITSALVAEVLIVGAASTVLGIGLAQAIVTLMAPVMEQHLGRSAPGGVGALAMGSEALIGAILIGLLVTSICCAVQLWASRRAPVALALSGGHKGASAGPEQRRAHAVLIAIEVAASLTLLVGAALMVQSGLRILNVEMGLETRNVLVGQVSLSQRRYPDALTQIDFYERARTGASVIAGVRGVGFANVFPLQAPPTRDVRRDEPQAVPAPAGLTRVSPEYFHTLDIALTHGRTFAATDRPATEPVAVISRALAERLWPGARAIGERMLVGPPQNARDQPPTSFLVVGVVADVRQAHTDNALADVYVSLHQFPSSFSFMYVRATGTPRFDREVRELLARLDPDLALARPRPLSDILDQQRAGTRFLASVLGVLALFAASLALVGIYGVIAYTVRQREREIAVRMAIGADRRMISGLFLRQGGSVLTAGLLIGVVGALLLGRLLQTQLFGVRPADPIVIAGVTLCFAVCGFAAIGWPAHAAASTDPAKALKD
jgi:putative ABC transport system permease protein